MRTRFVVLGTIVGASLVLTTAAGAVTTPLPTGETRLQGTDRYGTAAAISTASFAPPVEAVYVASGTNYPDALAAGPAAAKRDVPILLVGSGAVNESTKAELTRLTPETIYVIGGEAAVSGSTASELAGFADVVRLQGVDRYATAAEISGRNWDSAATVFVASGAGFADALSAGPAGAKLDGPLLLTSPTSLPEATRAELARLAPSQVYVLGGTAAVSAEVEQAIRTATGAAVNRISGADRYETSAAVARTFWSTMPSMFFATGLTFPDAVAGTPAAAVNDAPILLTKSTCMPKPIAALKGEKNPSRVVILGGTNAIAAGATNTTCTEPGEYIGSGDSVISITKPDGQASEAIATISYTGDGYFSVWGLNDSFEDVDLLANGIDSYAGTVLVDPDVTKLEITASGAWTIQIKPLGAARTFNSGTITGTGDDVLRWTGRAGTAYITHQGTGYFSVWSWPDTGYADLEVSEIGEYAGTVVFPAGPATLEISAESSWSIGIL